MIINEVSKYTKENRNILVNEELENVNKEIDSLKNILQKEIDFSNNLEYQQYDKPEMEKILLNDLKNMIQNYKDFSNMDILRTDDGCLKLVFYYLNLNNTNAFIKLELKNNSYHINDIFPRVDYKSLEKILRKNNNFTVFLAHLVKSFMEYFDNQ
jgi:hypothetical protein